MKFYLATMALNDVRASIMNKFDRKIFNSSFNIETYDQNILEKLKTFPQLYHAGTSASNFVDLPFMHNFRPENLESTYR